MSQPHPLGQRSRVVLLALGVALLASRATPCLGFDVVRFDGIVGSADVPNNVGVLTLAIGDKSVRYSVLAAQKITGNPAMAPEIFSALGPGPPPIRVEGRAPTVAKISDAKPGTRLTITGNLNAGNALLTLMEVEAAPTPSPAQ